LDLSEFCFESRKAGLNCCSARSSVTWRATEAHVADKAAASFNSFSVKDEIEELATWSSKWAALRSLLIAWGFPDDRHT